MGGKLRDDLTIGLMRSVLIDGGMPQGGAIHDIRGLEAHGSGMAPRRHGSRVWTDDNPEDPQEGA